MTEEQIVSCLRLFKAYLSNSTNELDTCKDVQEFKEDMLKKGLLFVTKTTEDIPSKVVEEAVKMYGVKEEEWNQTFHKSFATVRDTDIETLVIQQIVHYITTYGFEKLGIYDNDTVYVPKEELNIPELDRDIPLVIIKELTEEELGEKLLTLLTSGIALSEQTIQDVMNLGYYIPRDRFDDIKNKELKIALYDKYDIVPRNNVEFLRYMIYKLTGSTLLIKNTQTIRALKEADTEQVYKYLFIYLMNDTNSYKKLAEIFLRYKDLFLALKRTPIDDKLSGVSFKIEQLNKAINKISKLSKKYHKPLQPKILDRLTQLDSKEEIDLTDLSLKNKEILEELDNVTVFRELRILNGLKYRLQNPQNMLYKIRNGKGYVKPSKNYNHTLIVTEYIYGLVYRHLIDRLTPTLKDKTVYIPENINYTLPTSEKQFSENIPEGSYIEIPRTTNMTVGVHWKNVAEGRVDLDLHAQNKDEQFGWNTSYRSSSRNQFYYSGDLTNASGEYGATEVFYIGHSLEQKAFLLTLNDYASPSVDIPFEFFVAETDREQVDRDYTVNPNKVKFVVNEKFKYVKSLHQFESRQKVLAFIVIDKDTIKVYFNDFSLGNSIVTRQTNVTKAAFDCLQLQVNSQVMLKDVLIDCGVKLSDKPVYDTFEKDMDNLDENGNPLYKKVQHKVDYDLSLENVDKTTFIDLLSI